MKTFYDISRLMVGLDLSETDETVIRYTAFLARLTRPEKIYFIHIQKDLDLPEEARQEIYGSRDPYDELVRADMQKAIEAHFAEHADFQTEFLVVEGSPLPAMLHWTRLKYIDMLVIGRKNTRSSGTLLTRLTRRARCSVLTVPKGANLLLDNLLVCVDFSQNSAFAMEKALNLARLNGSTSVVYSQHIYQVPPGHSTTGKPFATVAGIMKKVAMKRHKEFMKPLNTRDLTLTPIFTLDRREDPTRVINQTASSIQADLVVVGSKGRTRAAAIFMGSFAEKLVQDESAVPLMVVKEKDEVMNVIAALKKL